MLLMQVLLARCLCLFAINSIHFTVNTVYTVLLKCFFFTYMFLLENQQEAPLTLRGERGRCRNIKGEPQITLLLLQFTCVECTERMVRRAQECIRCTNYRPVDYEKLHSEITERKQAGHEALMKLKYIKAASRQQKEENLGKQHCIVWQHELTHLAAVRQQLQSELDSMLLSLVGNDDNQLKHISEEFSSLASVLADDFFAFKSNTTDAIWSLRLSCILLTFTLYDL